MTDLSRRDDTEKLKSDKPFNEKAAPNPGDPYHNGVANGHHATDGRPDSSEV